jgi:hypothetical protein
MATGTIMLPTTAAMMPDGSTNNAAPGLSRVKSSATAPAYHFTEIAFDGAGSTREQCYWSFRLPTDYSSSPVLKIQWKANATTGNVVWQARIAAITPADADTPNEHALPASADTVTTGVNATEARRLVESSITLTNIDSMAAADWVVVNLYRDPSHASDTCTVDAEVVAVSLEYTTT